MKLKLEIVVSITAMITAVAAVVVAVLQTQVMHQELMTEREQARLSVLPSLFVYTGSHLGDDEGRFRIGVVNQGIGPAVVEGFSVSHGRKVAKTWAGLVADGTGGQVLMAGDDRNVDSITTTPVNPGVLMPAGSRVEPLLLAATPEIAEILRTFSDDLNVSICYCSLYQECWTVDMQEARPQSVDTCEPFKEDFFTNED